VSTPQAQRRCDGVRRTADAMRSDDRRLCAAALQRFRMARPPLRRDRARPCHICTGTALTPCSRFALGLGLTPRHVGAYRAVILVGGGAQRTDVLAPWALRRLRNADVDETCAAPPPPPAPAPHAAIATHPACGQSVVAGTDRAGGHGTGRRAWHRAARCDSDGDRPGARAGGSNH
jgi:hypothetical protein